MVRPPTFSLAPRVKDDRNLHGPGSIAVPGVVAGMEEAYRATPKWRGRTCSARALKLAGEGLLVDWWTTLMVASSAVDLPPLSRQRRRLSQRRPAAERTMGHQIQRAAAAGPAEGDDGPISPPKARAIFMRAIWRAASRPTSRPPAAALSVEDLAAFRAHGREALKIPYRGGNVFATPELTCGPTLAHTMRLLQQRLQPGRGGPDAAAYMEYALALQSAYRERLQDMGDADGRRALGAEHLAPACTTHFPSSTATATWRR